MISIKVAMDDDQLIGKKDSSNGMPWVNKEDLKHFKETTINKTILMGYTTYQAIGRPLPNRKTIVVSFYGLVFSWEIDSTRESDADQQCFRGRGFLC